VSDRLGGSPFNGRRFEADVAGGNPGGPGLGGPRRFSPSELDEDMPGAEQAALLATARELEWLADVDGIGPTAGFADRVMFAIAAEPLPRPVVAAYGAARRGRPMGVIAALGDLWRVGFGGGSRPMAARLPAMALLVFLFAGIAGLGVVGLGAVSRAIESPSSSAAASSQPTAASTEPPTAQPALTSKPTPSPTASPTPSPTDTPADSASPTDQATPSPTPGPTEDASGSSEWWLPVPGSSQITQVPGPTPVPPQPTHGGGEPGWTPGPTPHPTPKPHNTEHPDPSWRPHETPKPTERHNPTPTPDPTPTPEPNHGG
jgi:hypothetical protein